MSHFTLKRVQRFPISMEEAWIYFSSPRNLANITPPSVGFKQLSHSESETMYAGQLITYTISPVFGIPIFWMTEITHVAQPDYFIDEQRFGPYALWHHSHFFKSVSGGIEMTDLVQYRLPLGFLGQLAHRLFVGNQLEQIFAFREKYLRNKFGSL